MNPLENNLLGVSVKRPIGNANQIARLVTTMISEQVPEPVLADEGIAFDIEENVAGRWFGQPEEPRGRYHFEHFELPLASLPGAHLDVGLGSRFFEARRRTVFRLPRHRRGEVRERLCRRN